MKNVSRSDEAFKSIIISPFYNDVIITTCQRWKHLRTFSLQSDAAAHAASCNGGDDFNQLFIRMARQ